MTGYELDERRKADHELDEIRYRKERDIPCMSLDGGRER